ncbi:MAG: hypothetical protein ACXWUW_10020, partial [Rhodoplanes sp.]
QMLRITHFIGRSENAVRIQIAVALIAFVLLHLLHKMTKAQQGFLELVDSCAPISCTEKTPPACVRSNPPRKSTPVNWTSTGEIHEPDSRGSSPRMTSH